MDKIKTTFQAVIGIIFLLMFFQVFLQLARATSLSTFPLILSIIVMTIGLIGIILTTIEKVRK